MIKHIYLLILACIFFSSKIYAEQKHDISAQLFSDFQSNNQDKFLKDFPSDYKEFKMLFGINSSDEKIKNLYEKNHDLIEFLFSIKSTNSTKLLSNKIFDIAKDAIWEADAVNEFQHSLREKVKNKPQYLCELLKDREADELLKFSRFYFSGLYPSSTMPDELIIIQHNCSTIYEPMIDGFVRSLTPPNSTITPQNFIVNDSDGKTNLRAGPNAISKNIGTISNNQYIRSIYKKGNWIFVQNTFNNSYGYVNLKNVRAITNLDKDSLPFIGSKMMASPMGHMYSTIITIQLSGNTLVKICGEPTAGNGCSSVYRGAYSSPLIVDSKKQEGYYFKNAAVYDYLNGHIGEKLNFVDGDSW